MSLIVFRHLPAVAAIEEQLRLQSRGLLAEDEAEELPHLVDDASRALFGITANDTFYPALLKTCAAASAVRNGKRTSKGSANMPATRTRGGAASGLTSVARKAVRSTASMCSDAS